MQQDPRSQRQHQIFVKTWSRPRTREGSLGQPSNLRPSRKPVSSADLPLVDLDTESLLEFTTDWLGIIVFLSPPVGFLVRSVCTACHREASCMCVCVCVCAHSRNVPWLSLDIFFRSLLQNGVLFCFQYRPDMTFAVDWALEHNYLSFSVMR